MEDLYSQTSSAEIRIELDRTLTKLYAAILVYLSRAKAYLDRNTAKRILKSSISPEKEVDDCLKSIRLAQEEVRKSTELADRHDLLNDHAEMRRLLADIERPLQRMDDKLKDVQDQLQTSKRAEILTWMSPEPYIQHHEQSKRDVLQGTGQWLLSDSEFIKWRNDSASSMLWLHGIPGSGKSKLVSIVIEDALQSFRSGTSPQPVYFYCSRNSAEPRRSDPEAILASIARQLSSPRPGSALLQPAKDLYAMKEAEVFASGALRIEESRDLILSLIDQYPVTTIVFDALDECDPGKRRDFVKVLERILRESSSLVKIFVSSRNDRDIVQRLEHYPNLEIRSDRNNDDIDTFVKSQTRTLIEDGDLLQYSNDQARMEKIIVKKVIEGAHGMFRWASMQLQHLCSFDVDADIQLSLGRLPPDLYTLYAEIYGMLSNRPGKYQGEILRNVLSWVLCAQRRMRSSELLLAVSTNIWSSKAAGISSLTFSSTFNSHGRNAVEKLQLYVA